MQNRIPDYFRLSEFGISGASVVRMALHCDPEIIQPRVIVMPNWKISTFELYATNLVELVERTVYQLEYNGQPVTVIRSGVGAPNTGDIVLALGCTPCETLILAGSIGGLDASYQIGDLVIPSASISGDGFSRYLAPDGPLPGCDLRPACPDAALSQVVKSEVEAVCSGWNVPVRTGPIYCTDSIVAQFHHLDFLVESFGCIGIEMETSATFLAAQLVGIRAAALLQLSDVIPAHKTLFAGRTPEDRTRRHWIRTTFLAKAVLDSLVHS